MSSCLLRTKVLCFWLQKLVLRQFWSYCTKTTNSQHRCWGWRACWGNHIHHTETPDAVSMTMCVFLCYAIDCNILVTTPSTTSPTMKVWAACWLSHKSLEGESRKLLPITTPVRQFLMAAPPPRPDQVWHMRQWQADKHGETLGKPWHWNNVLSGEIPPMAQSLNKTIWLLLQWVTFHCNSFNWWYQELSSFSFVFLICCHSCSPPSLHIFYSFLCPFFPLVFTLIQRCLNPNITKLSIAGFLSLPILSSVISTFSSALIQLFQHWIQPCAIIEPLL